jgi:hypothetical protein
MRCQKPAIFSCITVARRFAASPAMMRYRLEQLGYIIVQGKKIMLGIQLRQMVLL